MKSTGYFLTERSQGLQTTNYFFQHSQQGSQTNQINQTQKAGIPSNNRLIQKIVRNYYRNNIEIPLQSLAENHKREEERLARKLIKQVEKRQKKERVVKNGHQEEQELGNQALVMNFDHLVPIDNNRYSHITQNPALKLQSSQVLPSKILPRQPHPSFLQPSAQPNLQTPSQTSKPKQVLSNLSKIQHKISDLGKFKYKTSEKGRSSLRNFKSLVSANDTKSNFESASNVFSPRDRLDEQKVHIMEHLNQQTGAYSILGTTNSKPIFSDPRVKVHNSFVIDKSTSRPSKTSRLSLTSNTSANSTNPNNWNTSTTPYKSILPAKTPPLSSSSNRLKSHPPLIIPMG